MDDPLRDNIEGNSIVYVSKVLILVVMDDPLRDTSENFIYDANDVLILVVMDDPLRVFTMPWSAVYLSLNPCCNG